MRIVTRPTSGPSSLVWISTSRTGVGAATKDAPRENLTTDPYYTHGLRYVLFFDSEPTSLNQIEILPWRSPSGGFIEAAADDSRP